MHEIFLSYAREDREKVQLIQAGLAQRGYDVFWDKAIRPGTRWDEELQTNLEQAKCVIVAWSAASICSHWVKDEAEYGRDRRTLLPVSIDGTPPPLGFRQIQTVDLSAWKGQPADPGFQQVVLQVEQLLGDALAINESVSAAATAPRTRRRLLIASGGLALVILGVGLLWRLPELLPDLAGRLVGPGAGAVRDRTEHSAANVGTLREPTTRFKECEECPTMVVLPVGQSLVGAPDDEIRSGSAASDQGPQHRIVVSRPMAISEREVTFGEFKRFVQESGQAPDSGCTIFEAGGFSYDPGFGFERPGYQQDADFPVVCVSFDDAQAYAMWLSKETGANYRLPSEAEWEYAARAGSENAFAFGENPAEFCRYANIADLSAAKVFSGWDVVQCDDGHARVAPTGSFAPNAFGLTDMHGNVWEWVADCWHGSYDLAPIDGSAWVTDGDCDRRVVRGGAWDTSPRDSRVSLRGKLSHDTRNALYGFRVARF